MVKLGNVDKQNRLGVHTFESTCLLWRKIDWAQMTVCGMSRRLISHAGIVPQICHEGAK
jgi:hypothetical protein